MSFTDAIKSCFNNYANFNGRARRSEYWYFFLFYAVISIVLSALARNSSIFSFISGIFSLALLVPNLAVSIRRLHDIGRSGWYYLISFIPVVGQIIMIVWFCQDSVPGTNMYGMNPKGIGGGGSFL
ncbi:MAG: DUF805 domain-containing protein [Lachnospiraceae bacterium]|nr:DUF805 domain-containing protein [Lachnospiraceae bacterium]